MTMVPVHDTATMAAILWRIHGTRDPGFTVGFSVLTCQVTVNKT